MTQSAARRSTIGRRFPTTFQGDHAMAKGMQQKKEVKKKPAKTLKEKRAEKASKKGAKA